MQKGIARSCLSEYFKLPSLPVLETWFIMCSQNVFQVSGPCLNNFLAPNPNFFKAFKRISKGFSRFGHIVSPHLPHVKTLNNFKIIKSFLLILPILIFHVT